MGLTAKQIYISRNFNKSLDPRVRAVAGAGIYISRNFNKSLDVKWPLVARLSST